MIPTLEDALAADASAASKLVGLSTAAVKAGWDLCLNHLIRAGMYPGTPKVGEIHPDGSEHLPAARRTLLDIAREKQGINLKGDARAIHRVLESEAGWKYAAFEKDTRIAKLDDTVRKLRAELVEFDSGYKRCRVCRNQWSSGDEEAHKTECVVPTSVPAQRAEERGGSLFSAKSESQETLYEPNLPSIQLPDPSSVRAAHDPVNHPSHYTSSPSGVECIDVIEHMTLNIGNAAKYLWRAGLKNDLLEDLGKARWYVDREIKRVTKLRAATMKETNRGTP